MGDIVIIMEAEVLTLQNHFPTSGRFWPVHSLPSSSVKAGKDAYLTDQIIDKKVTNVQGHCTVSYTSAFLSLCSEQVEAGLHLLGCGGGGGGGISPFFFWFNIPMAELDRAPLGAWTLFFSY